MTWETKPGWRRKADIPAARGRTTKEFLDAEADRARSAGYEPVGRGTVPPGSEVIAVPTCTSKGGPGIKERIYFSRWYRRPAGNTVRAE